jgi:hypothetical protein
MNEEPKLSPAGTVYQDKDRPNGVANADAPPPGWLEASLTRHTKSIMEALVRNIQHDQHEYLEHKRLPHTLQPEHALVKPVLMQSGEVVVMTTFPVAAETCIVVYITPFFEKGHDPLSANPTPSEEEEKVLGYKLFAYKEMSHFAVENVPQRLAPFLQEEICRQAGKLNLRQVQFLYATILTPQDVRGFEDPNNYLAKLTAQANAYVQQQVDTNAYVKQLPEPHHPDNVRRPTPIAD